MKHNIILIGLGEYENLGLEYISSVLSNSGFRAKVINLNLGNSSILKIIVKDEPILVGFSIIYLEYNRKFRDLISYLRDNDINCHFTAGGHYASLRYRELLSNTPLIDSVVRFEGEITSLELVKCISIKKDWRKIHGLAWRKGDSIISNPLRNFEKDLDNFPFPSRAVLKEYALWKLFASMIAGRGCSYNCSFCNTRKFYSNPPGAIKRVRKPEKVVKEMIELYHNKNCEIFLFLDDDFPISLNIGSKWIDKFCGGLKKSGLASQIMWKISCRPNEINEMDLVLMKRNGLFGLFIGIEDGSTEGLRLLNKCTTAECNLHAVSVIKKLKLRLDFGFLLFTPYTTFDSLKLNLGFLRKICGDGYTPVTFYKLIPYYDTQIEETLAKENRLKVTEDVGDYDFYQEQLNLYYEFVVESFSFWLWDTDGLSNKARWALDILAVYNHFYYKHSYIGYREQKIRNAIMDSNRFIISILEDVVNLYENKLYKTSDQIFVKKYSESIKEHHDYYSKLISTSIAEIIDYAQYQYIGNLILSSDLHKNVS